MVFKDAKDWTLLTFACSTGNVEAARLLLDRFADPNHLARDGASPLVLACGRGDIDLVDLLLDAHANVNRDAYGVTPLIAACAGGHVAVTWKLIESNADVNQGKRKKRQGKGRKDAGVRATRRRGLGATRGHGLDNRDLG